MSHTDLAILDQIQALELTLFRLGVTAQAEQKLPIKIPLKPMKTVAHAIDKVRYLRFSRSKGYHIALIPLVPEALIVLQTSQSDVVKDLLVETNTHVLYTNTWTPNATEYWLPQEAFNEVLKTALQNAAVPHQWLNPQQGQATLAGFDHSKA